ncbi:histidine utilization repressor [Ancylobacter terrae]|uniref:histidine utilization repressor n=1 Tax=Ancylobacter sp. sgz301288 TaxID=3342077 RepID=UPI00385B52FB
MSLEEREPVQTLNQRIRADIEEKILSGAWPPGHRVPFEHELMAQYGCARMTVNKVMSALVEAGLIERRRRAGTFVAQPRLQSAVLEIPDIPAEVRARGEEYALELLARRERRATRQDAAEAAMVTGERLLDLTCRHIANGRPFALEERVISLKTVPDAAGVDFGVVPAGSWLLGHVPWTEAEHRVTAINADAGRAERLAIQPGAACLMVERRTWRSGSTITFVRQIFRGDVYHLVARFSP